MALFTANRNADADYYLARAEAEVRAAEEAVAPVVREVHRRLARAYLGKVFGEEPLPAALARPGRRRQAFRSIARALTDVPVPIVPENDMSALLTRLDSLETAAG